MLKAISITKKYGNKLVLKNISFQVELGESVAILGPNGAGKTTSFYTIAGIVKPTTGIIKLNNKNITELPTYQRAKLGISYLPQEPSIFKDLTVYDNIKIILELNNSDPEEIKQKIQKVMEELSIVKIQNSYGSELSGGERRRVEVARMLAINPKYILLDEPFAGVDPVAVNEVKNIIFKLKNLGIGILITDHNVRETLNSVDRIYIVYQGEVIHYGTKDDIINHPKVREIYLGKDFKF